MSFLKAIGQGLVKVFGWLGGHAGEIQAVTAFLPGAQVASDIFGVIAAVEIIGASQSLTGPEKYAKAYHAIEVELAKSFPGVIKDQAMHDRAVAGLTQGAVDFLNSFKAPEAPAAPV